MAKSVLRKGYRVDTPRVFEPHDRIERAASAPHPCELFRLLSQREGASVAGSQLANATRGRTATAGRDHFYSASRRTASSVRAACSVSAEIGSPFYATVTVCADVQNDDFSCSKSICCVRSCHSARAFCPLAGLPHSTQMSFLVWTRVSEWEPRQRLARVCGPIIGPFGRPNSVPRVQRLGRNECTVHLVRRPVGCRIDRFA